MVDTWMNQEMNAMSLSEEKSSSFIVRVWREGGSTTKVEWRGSIEHVQTGKKSYFQDLKSIQTFMKPYLAAIGIETPEHFWELMTDPSMQPLVENLDAKSDSVTKKISKHKSS